MSPFKTVTLNSGYKIPLLGYGTWQAAPGEVGNGVYEALKIGYRHLDLAKIYLNQQEVGKGIRRALAEVPGLKREDIFITSKLWNNKHQPEDVEPALDDTLAELGLDYLDLFLVHWPVAFKPGSDLLPLKAGQNNEADICDDISIMDTWKAMTQLPKSKARSIGVSNYTIDHLKAIIKATGVIPAVNEVERHPRLPQREMVEYCRKQNIIIISYSAFGNNSLGVPLLVNTPEVKSIAEHLSKTQGKTVTAAQVILAWSQLGGHSVIPKSVTPSRILENFQDIDLDERAIKALDQLGENPQRFNIPRLYKPSWDIDVFGDEKEKGSLHNIILGLKKE